MLSKTHYRTMLISNGGENVSLIVVPCVVNARHFFDHVLNNCRVALLSGRCTWRLSDTCNAILKIISEYFNAGLKDGWEMTADLNGQYSLPVPLSHFTASPDIAIWNKTVLFPRTHNSI